MGVDAHATGAAELQERQDQVVVARVEIEPELDDRACLLEIRVCLLDRANRRQLRELRNRVRLEIEDDPRRDVVDDDRTVRHGRDLLEVRTIPSRRLVVVRRHDEEAVDAQLVCSRREVYRVRGGVRARAGDDSGAISSSSTAASYSRRRSSSESVGASPVVPVTTSPSDPLATRCAARARNASMSTEPSALKGVAIAVRISPSTSGVYETERQAPSMVKEFRDFLMRGQPRRARCRVRHGSRVRGARHVVRR